jgi:hypothetical protein
MRRFWIILVALLGLGATALPASADITYVLNCGGTPCPANSNNYGTVTLHQLGTGVAGSSSNIVEVTVNLITAGNNFAGTGAGYAINWNITGNPSLTTSLVSTGAGHPLPAGGIYNTSHFTIQDSTASGHTYKASPFGFSWMYAIDYNQNGGNSTNDNYLIFDVTKTNGLLIGNFAAIDGFYFAVDMFGGPCGPTCVVASNKTTVPEPGTVLMILAGLGSLFMLHQRRRKLVRAV